MGLGERRPLCRNRTPIARSRESGFDGAIRSFLAGWPITIVCTMSTAPATVTFEQFGKSVVTSGLLSGDELKAWYTSLPAAERPRDAEKFAHALVAHRKISKYQAQVLLQGKSQSLSFGNYVLT